MSHSFIKFLMVGVINTIVGLTMMYTFLDLFHLEYWLSTFLGNAIGAGVSYFLNKKFTFKSQAPTLGSGIRFIAVILVCYYFSYKIALIFVNYVLIHTSIFPSIYNQEIAVLIGSGLYTITNYLGQRFIVFPERTGKVEGFE